MRTVLLLLLIVSLAIAVPAAAAPEVRSCGNVDRSDRFGHPSSHGAFGIFNVRAQGVACRPARRLAHRWLSWAQQASNPSRPHVVGAKRGTPRRYDYAVPRSSSATHSMCGVCGNMSTGRTRLRV
jgi:hypothetical protein